MVKLSDLRSADEIHRQNMRDDPEYRRLYRRGWLLNRVQIAWLRLRVKLAKR